MNEFQENLWAPWRMEYIRSLAEDNKDGCFLCRYGANAGEDGANQVLWRTDHTFVVMNRFPYTNGHLLVSPFGHKEDLTDLDDDEFADLWRQTRDAKTVLAKALEPQGFNIGVNFGLCAGAGLPGHLHVHIVPRWAGDTNFMTVLGDVRVVPEAMDKTYKHLCDITGELGIPQSAGKPHP